MQRDKKDEQPSFEHDLKHSNGFMNIQPNHPGARRAKHVSVANSFAMDVAEGRRGNRCLILFGVSSSILMCSPLD